jgi:drug/metabolite transporter (DMT)-like permease
MIWMVVSRLLLSVTGNAVQKRLLLEGVRVRPLWITTYLLMLLPAFALSASDGLNWPSAFWGNVFLGGVLDAVGNLAMVAALRSTDLSVFGPLNAFRPVLALLFGWVFLGETPSLSGGAGVGVTVLGAMLLLGKPSGQGERRSRQEVWKVLGLRFAGLSLSTLGAVFLKRAAVIGSAEVTLTGWIVCGLGCLLVASVGGEGKTVAGLKATWRGHASWLVGHALIFLVMQWFTIRIFQNTLLAYSFAWFQLGMVLQVITGGLFFKEPALGRRLAGCVVMCLGSALVLWKG